MSKRGPKHQHHSASNRQHQREISCEELLQLAARSLRDARTNHDRGKTDLTESSKQYLRDIATDGGALARCRDCFPAVESEPVYDPDSATRLALALGFPIVNEAIEWSFNDRDRALLLLVGVPLDNFRAIQLRISPGEIDGGQELGVQVDATNRPGALNGTDTEHVAASAGEVASNGEQPALQKPTAHTQPLSLSEHSFRDHEAIPSL